MKTLYLECGMGAAGDMLTAALLELCDREAFLRKMNALGLPHTTVAAETVSKCGICGTQVRVSVGGTEEESRDVPVHHHDTAHSHPHEHPHHHEHPHEHPHHHDGEHAHHAHSHASPEEILHRIASLDLSARVRNDAAAVYRLLAEAESHAHGRPVGEIHFHEVGTLDALADIVGVCLLMEMLSPDRVFASPVHTGSGHVHCAHGILPVPAPATAYLLRGIPICSGTVQGELCTPTGAALLRYFVQEFGEMPQMKTEQIGYGFGKKEFPQLNCVRAFWGESSDETEQIYELRCNLDDMTPEQIGYAAEKLFEAGALDVFTLPAGMKKNRPGVLLTVLCRPDQREVMVREIFRHTVTLGIRETVCRRYKLHRSESVRHTRYGDVRVKTAEGYGVRREKPEYEDLARLADENGIPLSEILKENGNAD